MRNREVISQISPCDNDYIDSSLQTIADFGRKGSVYCTNLQQCQRRSPKENISCARRIAQQMAILALSRMEQGLSQSEAVEAECLDYLESGPDGKFWVCENGKWKIAPNKVKAMLNITAFADIIIG